MSDRVAALAEAVLDGDWARARTECEAVQVTAAAVATGVADGLRADAARGFDGTKARTWFEGQGAVLALAACAGVDRPALAAAMIEVCFAETFLMHGGLDKPVLDWLRSDAPEALERAVDQASVTGALDGHIVSIARQLWDLPGSEGTAWTVRIAANPGLAPWFDTVSPQLSPSDQAARFHAIADARFDPAPRLHWRSALSAPGVPRPAVAAFLRMVVTYSAAPTEWQVYGTAAAVRERRSTRPEEDLDLFWWSWTDRDRELARWMLELGGDPGARFPLVEAAKRNGRVHADLAHFLLEPLDRPAWADGQVPWSVKEIAAARLRLPDGRLFAGDPQWDIGFEIEMPAGSYDVDIVIASHPLSEGGCAAAADLTVRSGRVVSWRLAGEYVPEFSIAGYAAAPARNDADFDQMVPLIGISHHGVIDCGAAGDVVWFMDGRQHGTCRVWEGRTAEHQLARVITDLGTLEYDLTADPVPPWDAVRE